MTQLYRDDFLGGAGSISGSNAAAGIGELGWNAAAGGGNGTITQQPARGGRLGIVRCSSNSSGGRQGMYLGTAVSGGKLIEQSQIVHVEFTIALIANRFRFGIGAHAVDTGFGDEGIYLQAQPGLTPNEWQAISRVSNVPYVKQTGVELAYGPDNWLRGKFERMLDSENVTTGWKVYIDDVLVATFEDGVDPIPSFDTALLFGVQSTQGDSQQSHADIDTFELARV